MTTVAALMGGVPLMLGTGTGSQIRQPLGYAIVGGLLISQLLTLFTTPGRLHLHGSPQRLAWRRIEGAKRCGFAGRVDAIDGQAKPDAPGGRKVGQMVV